MECLAQYISLGMTGDLGILRKTEMLLLSTSRVTSFSVLTLTSDGKLHVSYTLYKKLFPRCSLTAQTAALYFSPFTLGVHIITQHCL